jgi:Domain of unknown function (DUF4380)
MNTYFHTSSRIQYLICIVCGCLVLSGMAVSAQPNAIKTVNDHTYQVQSGDAIMKISVNGGRIISFNLNDHEFLTSASQHENFGSTLWTAPQSNWGWPPFAVLDENKYQVEFTGDILKMKSQPDPASGFQIEKSWQPIGNQSIRIEYVIRNISDQEKSVGPWEVSRVPCGGIVLFPDGGKAEIPVSSLVADKKKKGINWLSIDKTPKPDHVKLFATASEGWLAYALDGVLFVKQFPDIKPGEYSPQQGEVEVYTRSDKSYSELENHGAYCKLKPGETLTYQVVWSLVKIPAFVKSSIGNYKLATLARKQLVILNPDKLAVTQ